MFTETSNGEHNAYINLNRNYMYKDTSYLGSRLPQVTFSKRNKHCSFRLMEQNKTKQNIRLLSTGSNPGLQSSILIQDESLIFQDALDTVKN